MALNQTKLYEVENGLKVTDGPIYTGGPSSPIGLDFPVDTIYAQNLGTGGIVLWRKYNTGINDWTRISQDDFVQREQTLGNVTNATTTYVTMVTLTTPSLPLGDYVLEWNARWATANANRGIQFDVQDNTVSVQNITDFTASVSSLMAASGFVNLNGISGIHTLSLLFRTAIGTTTLTVSNARLNFRRVL